VLHGSIIALDRAPRPSEKPLLLFCNALSHCALVANHTDKYRYSQVSECLLMFDTSPTTSHLVPPPVVKAMVFRNSAEVCEMDLLHDMHVEKHVGDETRPFLQVLLCG